MIKIGHELSSKLAKFRREYAASCVPVYFLPTLEQNVVVLKNEIQNFIVRTSLTPEILQTTSVKEMLGSYYTLIHLIVLVCNSKVSYSFVETIMNLMSPEDYPSIWKREWLKTRADIRYQFWQIIESIYWSHQDRCSLKFRNIYRFFDGFWPKLQYNALIHSPSTPVRHGTKRPRPISV